MDTDKYFWPVKLLLIDAAEPTCCHWCLIQFVVIRESIWIDSVLYINTFTSVLLCSKVHGFIQCRTGILRQLEVPNEEASHSFLKNTEYSSPTKQTSTAFQFWKINIWRLHDLLCVSIDLSTWQSMWSRFIKTVVLKASDRSLLSGRVQYLERA